MSSPYLSWATQSGIAYKVDADLRHEGRHSALVHDLAALRAYGADRGHVLERETSLTRKLYDAILRVEKAARQLLQLN